MNNFWIGSAITLILVTPIVIFLAMNADNGAVKSSTSEVRLEQAGELPDQIYTFNDKCANEMANSSSGAVSADCINYETNLTQGFMEKIKEEVSADDKITCAKNLPKDLSELHKKFEGNKAKVVIEGKNIIEGKEEDAEDLEVEFTKIEDDWEITDIRCLE